MSNSVQKKNPRGLADTSRASPLECLLSRGLGLIADPIGDFADTELDVASARSQIPNGIYIYIYQIERAEVEIILHQAAELVRGSTQLRLRYAFLASVLTLN